MVILVNLDIIHSTSYTMGVDVIPGGYFTDLFLLVDFDDDIAEIGGI